MDVRIITKDLSRSISKHSPSILTAVGVAGLVSTVIMAIKATPKAMEIIEMEEKYRFSEIQDPRYGQPITPLEKVEMTWKVYIPTIGMGVLTSVCIVGANRINLRRNAALASLYTIADTALREYQAKVVETIGENKENKIQEELAQDRLKKNPVDQNTIIITGKGDFLCYDSFSGRYFQSNIDSIKKAENEFNQRMLREGWLGINHFYDLLGLEEIELGDEMGWIAERNLLEVRYDTKLAKEDVPCLVMSYRAAPDHI
jgi:hypothetical protein